MTKFLFTYRVPRKPLAEVRGEQDDGARARRVAAWNDWFDVMGEAVISRGEPVGDARELGDCGAETRIGGYSLVEADGFDAAIELARGCPGVARGGGVEIGALVPPDIVAPAGTASPDYQKTIRLKASPGALFDALTTLSGLAAWWHGAEGAADAGGELRFFFSSPDPLVMRVDEATRPTSVRWSVTECAFMPDWVGTRPTFTITRVDDKTSELNFRHYGLTPELDCFELCRPSWDHFIAKSLREYVEGGRGHPRGSEADQAWRRALNRATAEVSNR